MQLLVRVVDKTNPDNPALDAKLTKAGDVIVVKNDGETWGLQEINNPEWRIIHCRGMTEDQALTLVHPELPTREGSGLLRRRAVRLDVARLADVMDAKDLMDVVIPKEPLADAIGEDLDVIG